MKVSYFKTRSSEVRQRESGNLMLRHTVSIKASVSHFPPNLEPLRAEWRNLPPRYASLPERRPRAEIEPIIPHTVTRLCHCATTGLIKRNFILSKNPIPALISPLVGTYITNLTNIKRNWPPLSQSAHA